MCGASGTGSCAYKRSMRSCDQLTAEQRYGDAVRVGLAVVAAEPLRESAHRAVVGAHIAEGNFAEALRHYETYKRILAAELGLEPSASRMMALLETIRRGSGLRYVQFSLFAAGGGDFSCSSRRGGAPS